MNPLVPFETARVHLNAGGYVTVRLERDTGRVHIVYGHDDPVSCSLTFNQYEARVLSKYLEAAADTP